MKLLTIYSKDYCQYCTLAKGFLKQLEIPYEEIDVTHDFDLLLNISQKSGLRTVPQIFLGEKCLGGYNEMIALHQRSELLPLLK